MSNRRRLANLLLVLGIVLGALAVAVNEGWLS